MPSAEIFPERHHLATDNLAARGRPKLASRARLLQAGDVNKNDPSDALSVAVAALRSMSRRQVTADDCVPVLKGPGGRLR